MGKPTVYPMGVTIYNPEKCYNGYTVFPATDHGAVIINMNGKVEHIWRNFLGFPNKLLPGGIIMGNLNSRDGAFSYQDQTDVVEADWDGNILWKYDGHEYIEDEGNEPQWMARQHHDFQREGNPVGYYVPGMMPKMDGKTLILAHSDVKKKKISPHLLLDDCIYEVDREGKKIWEWNACDHFDEIPFDTIAKMAIYKNPNIQHRLHAELGDYLHINCASYLGPNKWYDQGDERFNPENIIIDSREANFMAIISKETGKFVWMVGPDYTDAGNIGQVIGPHHTHMIPQGLPGAGNIMVFDNGGWGGYGTPNILSPKGMKVMRRDYSRVVEFDPITLEIKWQFSAEDMKVRIPSDAHFFYSPLVSSAQRLPNGNTLITEGSSSRLLEVTEDKEIVWEYVSPYYKKNTNLKATSLYRAYRYPYDWVPQLNKPEEVAIAPPSNFDFRLPGAAGMGYDEVSVSVAGTKESSANVAACVEKLE